MTKKFLLVTVVFLLLFSVASCTSKPGPFEELKCQPPCWQGLTPGETTKSELIDFLYASPLIDKESIVEGEEYRIFQSNVSFNLKSGTGGEGYFLDNVLGILYLFDDLDIKFIDAVDFFGEPKFLLVYADFCNPPPRLSLGDASCSTIHAFNPEIGVVYGYQTKLSDHIKIAPNNRVTTVGFFNPNDYSKLVEGGAFYGFDHDKFLQYTRPWTGYGLIPEQ